MGLWGKISSFHRESRTEIGFSFSDQLRSYIEVLWSHLDFSLRTPRMESYAPESFLFAPVVLDVFYNLISGTMFLDWGGVKRRFFSPLSILVLSMADLSWSMSAVASGRMSIVKSWNSGIQYTNPNDLSDLSDSAPVRENKLDLNYYKIAEYMSENKNLPLVDTVEFLNGTLRGLVSY